MNHTVMKGCFVTGTDTGVGKTRVSAALLHWLGRQGRRAAGYKPVASGLDIGLNGQLVNEDVDLLHRASTAGLAHDEVGPCQLHEACAPHIAAELEHKAINRAALVHGAHALAHQADFLVIEGAGGLCVPLGADWDSSHLMCALGLPVVLVVGMRLGCINHALLTAEAVIARKLRLGGWVASCIEPDMPHLQRNLETLRHEFSRRHQAPCLGVVPHLPDTAPAAVAQHLDSAALSDLFDIPALVRLSRPGVPA